MTFKSCCFQIPFAGRVFVGHLDREANGNMVNGRKSLLRGPIANQLIHIALPSPKGQITPYRPHDRHRQSPRKHLVEQEPAIG
jgi:hypothetical protein